MKRPLLFFGIITLVLTAGCTGPQGTEDIDCSAQDIPEPLVSLEDVKANAPEQFKDIVTKGIAGKCVDRSLAELRVVCMACGLECASRWEHLWGFSYEGKELYAYPLRIPCQEDGIEYVPKGDWAEAEIIGGSSGLIPIDAVG